MCSIFHHMLALFYIVLKSMISRTHVITFKKIFKSSFSESAMLACCLITTNKHTHTKERERERQKQWERGSEVHFSEIRFCFLNEDCRIYLSISQLHLYPSSAVSFFSDLILISFSTEPSSSRPRSLFLLSTSKS